MLAFFYNLLVTMGFVTCAVLFLELWRRDRDRTFLWLAVMFGLFVLDNLLIYMDELMPGFDLFLANNMGVYLALSNLSGIAITLSYERVTRHDLHADPGGVRWPVWGALVAAYVVLGIYGESPWARAVTVALRGLLPLVVMALAMRGGDVEHPVIPLCAIQAFLAFQVANTVEMVLAYAGVRLLPVRYVSIEVLSIVCVVAGVAFCARRLREPAGEGAAGGDGTDANERVALVGERYGLTEREREIMGLLYEGHSNQQIAERTFISEGTVKTHVHNILRKTGCENRVQLLRLVADLR